MDETTLRAATIRRIQVLELRQRLELVTARAFDATCDPVQPGKQNKLAKRLLFHLRDCDSPADFCSRYALVQLARHVYARTSDVLHGRLSMLNVPQTAVDEWRAIVEELEAFEERHEEERHEQEPPLGP